MPVTEGEWNSIRSLIQRMVGHGGKDNYFTATVIRNDTTNKLVWVKELGSQAIPVVGLDYEVKYYDTDSTGIIKVKKAVVTPAVPKVGEKVLIILEMGAQSLPRCLGKLHGRNWVTREDETGFGGDV